MKVVAVQGSPRKKGNSNSVANAFIQKAQEMGAEVETFFLNIMDYKGCQGCESCKQKTEKCVLKDDLTQVFDSLEDADVFVMASPVYYYDVSGQIKLFVDRTYSWLKPDFEENPDPSRLPAGKKGLLILSQGAAQDTHQDIADKYGLFMDYWGIKDRETIRAVDTNNDTTQADLQTYKDQAVAIAQKWLA